MESYKSKAIENCTLALPEYYNSHLNFKGAMFSYTETYKYVDHEKYKNLLENYMSLSDSGSKLSMLRSNSTNYLRLLAENLTWVNETVEFMENVTILLDLLEGAELELGMESQVYEEIKEEINDEGYYRPE
jgi:hypothetical protein